MKKETDQDKIPPPVRLSLRTARSLMSSALVKAPRTHTISIERVDVERLERRAVIRDTSSERCVRQFSYQLDANCSRASRSRRAQRASLVSKPVGIPMRYSCNQGGGSTRSPKYYSARRCKNQGWWKRGRHLGRKRMYCNIIHQVVTTGYAEGIPQACDQARRCCSRVQSWLGCSHFFTLVVPGAASKSRGALAP